MGLEGQAAAVVVVVVGAHDTDRRATTLRRGKKTREASEACLSVIYTLMCNVLYGENHESSL